MHQEDHSSALSEDECDKPGAEKPAEEDNLLSQSENGSGESSIKTSNQEKSLTRSVLAPSGDSSFCGQMTECKMDSPTEDTENVFLQFNIRSDHEKYLKRRRLDYLVAVNESSFRCRHSISCDEPRLRVPTKIGTSPLRIWDAQTQYMPDSNSSSEEEPLYGSTKTCASERSISSTDIADANDDDQASAKGHGKRCSELPDDWWPRSDTDAEGGNRDNCSSSSPNQQANVDEDISGPSSSGVRPAKKVSSIPRNELRKLLLRRNSSFSAMTCRTLLEMKRAGRLDPNALPFVRKSAKTKYLCPESWIKQNMMAGASRTTHSGKSDDDPAEMCVTSTSDRSSTREVSRCRSLSASPDEDATQVDDSPDALSKSNDGDRISPKCATLRDEACSDVVLGGTSLKFSFVPDDVLEMQCSYKDDSDAECCCHIDDEQLYPSDLSHFRFKVLAKNGESSSVTVHCSSGPTSEQNEIVKEVPTCSDDTERISQAFGTIPADHFLQNGMKVSVKREPLDADSAGFEDMLSTSDETFPTNRRELDDQENSSPRCSLSNESASNSFLRSPVESENEDRSPTMTMCKEEPVSENEEADLQLGIGSDFYVMSCKEEIASDEALDSNDGKTRQYMIQQYPSEYDQLRHGKGHLHSAGATKPIVSGSPERLKTSSGLFATFPQANLSCSSTAGDSRNVSPSFALNPENFTFFMEPLSPQREALDLSLKGKPPPPPTPKLWPAAAVNGRMFHPKAKGIHVNEVGSFAAASSAREGSDADVNKESDGRNVGFSKESSTMKDGNGSSESASDQYFSDNNESLSPGRLVIDLPTRSPSSEQFAANGQDPTKEGKSPLQKLAHRSDTKSFPRKPVKSGELNGVYGNIAWRGTTTQLRPSLARSILRWPPVRMGQHWMQCPRPLGVGPRFASPQHPIWPHLSPPPVLSNPRVARSTGRQDELKGHPSWMRPSTSLRPAVSSSLPRIPTWVRHPIPVAAAPIIPQGKSAPVRAASALALGSQSPSTLSAVSTRNVSDSLVPTSRASNESKSKTGRRATTSLQWRKFSRQYDESRNKTPRGTVHECQCCGRVFSCRSHKERHMLSHTGLKPHPCPVCLKGFRRKDDVKIHMLTHTGQRPHECKLCLKRFAHKGTLNKHMLIHSGLKPHKCNVCERSFRRREHLTVHMLTHTGEKPFECHVCHNRYRRRDLLKSHVLAHSGKKHFTCTECNRGFSHKSSLNYHMLTHTGVRPHQCDECHKRFTHKGNLNKHKLIHTKRKESDQTSFEVVCE